MRTVKIKEIPEKCQCGKGYCSRIDGLCQNCRGKHEVRKFNAFWAEVEAKGISQSDWEFKYLCAKHFGVVYAFID